MACGIISRVTFYYGQSAMLITSKGLFLRVEYYYYTVYIPSEAVTTQPSGSSRPVNSITKALQKAIL